MKRCKLCGDPLMWSVYFDVPLYDQRGYCNTCANKVNSWFLNLGIALEDAVWAARPDMLAERAKAVMKGDY